MEPLRPNQIPYPEPQEQVSIQLETPLGEYDQRFEQLGVTEEVVRSEMIVQSIDEEPLAAEVEVKQLEAEVQEIKEEPRAYTVEHLFSARKQAEAKPDESSLEGLAAMREALNEQST